MTTQVPPLPKPGSHHTATPPIRIDSTIQLAWGLTLNFSNDANERAVGANFLKWFDSLRQLYKHDPQAQAYLDDLSALLTGYLRTSGYERDVLMRQLDGFNRIRETSIKSINEVADPSSVSIGSFLSKLSAFLGVGSLAGLIGTVTNYAPTTGLPFNLELVVLFGLLGIAAVMGVFWASRSWMIRRVENRTFDQQAKFFRAKIRPRFAEELFQFATRLKALAKQSGYDEDTLSLDDMGVRHYIDRILPNKYLFDIKVKGGGPFYHRTYDY